MERSYRAPGPLVAASTLIYHEAAWMHLSEFGGNLDEAPLFKGTHPTGDICTTHKYLHDGVENLHAEELGVYLGRVFCQSAKAKRVCKAGD